MSKEPKPPGPDAGLALRGALGMYLAIVRQALPVALALNRFGPEREVAILLLLASLAERLESPGELRRDPVVGLCGVLSQSVLPAISILSPHDQLRYRAALERLAAWPDR